MGTRKFLIIFGIASSVAVLLLVLLLLMLSPSEVARDISGKITISSDWIEVTPEKPMKATHRTQYVILEVSDPHTPYTAPFDPNDKDWGKSWAMRFEEDNSLVRPQVQIVDEFGRTFELESPGFTHKDRTTGDQRGGMAFTRDFDATIDSNLPKDRLYRTVRIRSDHPIHCTRIIWECRTGK